MYLADVFASQCTMFLAHTSQKEINVITLKWLLDPCPKLTGACNCTNASCLAIVAVAYTCYLNFLLVQ